MVSQEINTALKNVVLRHYINDHHSVISDEALFDEIHQIIDAFPLNGPQKNIEIEKLFAQHKVILNMDYDDWHLLKVASDIVQLAKAIQASR